MKESEDLVSLFFHVFRYIEDSDIQKVWDYYRKESLIITGYGKSRNPDAGENMLSRYKKGDEILVYAVGKELVGYAIMHKDKEDTYRRIDNPFIISNSPIDQLHVINVKYERWVEDVESAINFQKVSSILHYNPGLRGQAVLKCKAKSYSDIQDLVSHLEEVESDFIPQNHSQPTEKTIITYIDFGDAPNDDPDELQQFATRVRRGQLKFRENLLKAYKEMCVISEHGPKEVLEAVHIEPHARTGINELDNGLLLRCDLHSLFDVGLLRINPEFLCVEIDRSLEHTPYWELHGKHLRPKADGSYIGTKYLK
jgi:HNH endonuclease